MRRLRLQMSELERVAGNRSGSGLQAPATAPMLGSGGLTHCASVGSLGSGAGRMGYGCGPSEFAHLPVAPATEPYMGMGHCASTGSLGYHSAGPGSMGRVQGVEPTLGYWPGDVAMPRSSCAATGYGSAGPGMGHCASTGSLGCGSLGPGRAGSASLELAHLPPPMAEPWAGRPLPFSAATGPGGMATEPLMVSGTMPAPSSWGLPRHQPPAATTPAVATAPLASRSTGSADFAGWEYRPHASGDPVDAAIATLVNRPNGRYRSWRALLCRLEQGVYLCGTRRVHLRADGERIEASSDAGRTWADLGSLASGAEASQHALLERA